MDVFATLVEEGAGRLAAGSSAETGVMVPWDMVGLGGEESMAGSFQASGLLVGVCSAREGSRIGVAHVRGMGAQEPGCGRAITSHGVPLRGKSSEQAWEGLCAV